MIKVEIKSKETINTFNQKVADFIPIACHYNDTTLLTKNADLVQTIEIQGFIDKNSDEQQRVLRDDVRSAIANHLKDLALAHNHQKVASNKVVGSCHGQPPRLSRGHGTCLPLQIN